jgi:hypothetical protein
MPKRKKPHKPTQHYGYVAFAKTGRVTKHMFKLSDIKDIQEREVADRFVQQIMTQHPDVNIKGVDALPEADQDFLLHTNHGKITLQVTEIPERDYIFPISEEEYKSRRHRGILVKKNGEIPWAVDESRLDTSIQRAIENKLAKHYAKGTNENLWLLVFSTSPYLTTVYYEEGRRRESMAYQIARDYLAGTTNNPFDEIWYTNLLTRAVRIWPAEDNN